MRLRRNIKIMQNSTTATHFASPSIINGSEEQYWGGGTEEWDSKYQSPNNISSPSTTSGGFVKASSLLLTDYEEEAFYDVALLKCENCTYTRVAGCYCLDDNSSVNNLKNIHNNFKIHEQKQNPSLMESKRQVEQGHKHGNNKNGILTPITMTKTPKFIPHPMFHAKNDNYKSELSLCTIPVLNNLNQANKMHLQCRSGQCNTIQMKNTGCPACLSPSENIKIMKVALQKSEIKYALDGFHKDFGGEILHTVLHCSHCSALGFPGVADKLTTIHVEHDGSYEIKHSFWCSKTNKPMSKTSWNGAFGHKQSCPMKNKTPNLIETRLRLDDLKIIFNSFNYSISNNYIEEKLKENKSYRANQRQVWMKMVKNLTNGKNDDEILEILNKMIYFILENKFQLYSSYIYDIPILNLKQQIVEKLKLKHRELSQQNMWNEKVRKKCGILLRIIRAFVNSSNFKLCNPLPSSLPLISLKSSILHINKQIDDSTKTLNDHPSEEKGEISKKKKTTTTSNDTNNKVWMAYSESNNNNNDKNNTMKNTQEEEHKTMSNIEIVQQDLIRARTVEAALNAAKEISEMAISKASEEMSAGH